MAVGMLRGMEVERPRISRWRDRAGPGLAQFPREVVSGGGRRSFGAMAEGAERAGRAPEPYRRRAVESNGCARRGDGRLAIPRGHLAVRPGRPEYGGILPAAGRIESPSVVPFDPFPGDESSPEVRATGIT